MESKRFFYGRISDKTQNEARQTELAKELGIDERDTYIDKQSGKSFDRPKYQALKQVLRQGDVIYIKSLDRLGRNYTEIQKEWSELINELGVDIVVCDMPLLNTTVNSNDLTGKFISDLVLQILSYVAEQERLNIRARQRERY